ncbi:ComEA family DNA-binding protein [Kingella potus]|uniref:ComEA family DNA-binding protein n=1 Tax=Kingella potus TaxID=265175 RepID=UPI001FD094D0|nr:helix-hairpin-helix domain-containing protein [Kingella potus]UOP00761.1 helix-hairpin-helix domain-containing protein [Kingella potus]
MNLKKSLFGLLAYAAAALVSAAVNINTATAEELKALPGIGQAKAQAIVDYRKENGAFKSVDDLKKVKGIGDGILGKLKDQATVGAAPAAKPAKPAQAAVPPPKNRKSA